MIIIPAISIHALREEGDQAGRPYFRTGTHFYPRPPRGGRRSALRAVVPQDGISIHALREEGDKRRGAEQQNDRYFYPRPPRGGRLPKLQQSET